jgi:hypothetical protein
MGVPLTTSFVFARAADDVRSNVASYTPGAGHIALAAGGGAQFATPLAVTGKIYVTAITAATYGTTSEVSGTYSCTGVTGDTLTGLTLISGTDNAWVVGDDIEMRNNANLFNDLETAINSLPGVAAFGASGNTTASPGNLFLCNATNASFTITLEAATPDGSIGGAYFLATSGSNTVSVATSGSDTFWDGTTLKTLTLLGQLLIIQYSTTGAQWAPFAVPAPQLAQGSGVTIATSGGVQTISATGTTNASLLTSGTLPAARLPALTGAVTSTAGTAATTFGAIAALDVLANTTGATAAPAGVTLTSLIDASFGGTEGSFLVRGEEAWELFAPGAVGQFLATGGTGALPSWGTPSGGGTPGGPPGAIQFDNAGSFGGTTNFGYDTTNTSPIWTPQADPTSPAAGDLWLSTASLAPNFCRTPGLSGPISQRIFKCGSCSPVVNTGAQSTIFTSPTGAIGSTGIPASSLAAGAVLRFVLTAQYSVASGFFNASVFLGGQSIISSPASLTLSDTVTNQLVVSNFGQLVILSTGTSAAVTGAGSLIFVQSASSQPGLILIPGGSNPILDVDINSEVEIFFDVQVQWTVASPSNSFQCLSFSLYAE